MLQEYLLKIIFALVVPHLFILAHLKIKSEFLVTAFENVQNVFHILTCSLIGKHTKQKHIKNSKK